MMMIIVLNIMLIKQVTDHLNFVAWEYCVDHGNVSNKKQAS